MGYRGTRRLAGEFFVIERVRRPKIEIKALLDKDDITLRDEHAMTGRALEITLVLDHTIMVSDFVVQMHLRVAARRGLMHGHGNRGRDEIIGNHTSDGSRVSAWTCGRACS